MLQYQYLEINPARTLPNPILERFPPLHRSQLHPFYAKLQRDGDGPPVIEYPFVIGDPYNRMYFAQWLHQRRVLAGYWDSGATWREGFGLAFAGTGQPAPDEGSRGYLMGYATIDNVLGRWSGDRRLRFATVVDLGDSSQVRASGAGYVIVHWNLPREFLRLETFGRGLPDADRYLSRLRAKLAVDFGEPVLEDGVLSVFSIRR